MSDEPEESSSESLVLNRRDFLQLSAASAVFAPTLLDEYATSMNEGPHEHGPLSEEAADLRPPPTERRDYFPLESELVSFRGLAPASSDAEDGGLAWLDDQTISLRNLAAWRSNSAPSQAFRQTFPNSLRELITPQGDEIDPQGEDLDSRVDDLISRVEKIVAVPESAESMIPDFSGWENWVGGYENREATNMGSPDSQDQLVRVVRHAAKNDIRFRAVGSGHSHSDAAAPKNWYTNMKGVSGEMDQPWLRDEGADYWKNRDVDPSHLIRLGAGTVLRDLNRNILAGQDLALGNMGSFDGQTLAGAINTSTHGTGLKLAPIADLVESVEIVTVPESQYEGGTPYVRLLRIEPDEGITDPAKFAKDADTHNMGLIQNDDLFHSVVVGYGCMGIAYAYTLKVRDFYWLEEETTLMPWNTLKEKMSPSGDETKAEGAENFMTKNGSRDVRHFQFLFNVAAMQSPDKSLPADDHQINDNPICLVRRHYKIDADEIPDEPDNWEGIVLAWSQSNADGTVYDPRWPPERRSRKVQAALRGLGNKIHPLKPNGPRAKQLHNRFFHTRAEDPPFVGGRSKTAWHIALRRLRDKNEPTPVPPPQRATTTEVAVPLEYLVEAVDTVKNKVKDVKAKKKFGKRDVFFFPPMGVRFTAKSGHFLSAEYDRPTAMLEVPFNVYEKGVYAAVRNNVPDLSEKELRDEVAKPALEEIEDPLVRKFDGRPHMGKHNTVNARSNRKYMRPQNMYPGYEKWLDAYRYLNRFSTFDGVFSDHVTP